MAKSKAKRPCEESDKPPYRCYWQVQGMCAAYNPSVENLHGWGLRIPKFSSSQEVPLDFCKATQILRNDMDAWFNHNTLTMRYVQLRETLSKQDIRDISDSGSSSKKQTKKPVADEADNGPDKTNESLF